MCELSMAVLEWAHDVFVRVGLGLFLLFFQVGPPGSKQPKPPGQPLPDLK